MMYGLVFKIHKPLNSFLTVMRRRSSKENLFVVLVVKRWLEAGYVHLALALQTQSRLKYKQAENKVLKKICRNTSITKLSPLNEKCFCFKTLFMFLFSVKNFAFCYLASVSSGLFLGEWVKMSRE